MNERNQEDTSPHLEQQEHPGDAEADEGALNKVAHPHQTELQDYDHNGQWISKGLDVKDGSALKKKNWETAAKRQR